MKLSMRMLFIFLSMYLTVTVHVYCQSPEPSLYNKVVHYLFGASNNDSDEQQNEQRIEKGLQKFRKTPGENNKMLLAALSQAAQYYSYQNNPKIVDIVREAISVSNKQNEQRPELLYSFYTYLVDYYIVSQPLKAIEPVKNMGVLYEQIVKKDPMNSVFIKFSCIDLLLTLDYLLETIYLKKEMHKEAKAVRDALNSKTADYVKRGYPAVRLNLERMAEGFKYSLHFNILSVLSTRVLIENEEKFGKVSPELLPSLELLEMAYGKTKQTADKLLTVKKRILQIQSASSEIKLASQPETLSTKAFELWLSQGNGKLEVEKLFLDALKQQEQHQSADERALLRALQNLEDFYQLENDEHKIIPLYESSLNRLQKQKNEANSLLLICYKSLARLHMEKENFSGAESMQTQALETAKQVYGHTSLRTATELVLLANLYSHILSKGEHDTTWLNKEQASVSLISNVMKPAVSKVHKDYADKLLNITQQAERILIGYVRKGQKEPEPTLEYMKALQLILSTRMTMSVGYIKIGEKAGKKASQIAQKATNDQRVFHEKFHACSPEVRDAYTKFEENSLRRFLSYASP